MSRRPPAPRTRERRRGSERWRSMKRVFLLRGAPRGKAARTGGAGARGGVHVAEQPAAREPDDIPLLQVSVHCGAGARSGVPVQRGRGARAGRAAAPTPWLWITAMQSRTARDAERICPARRMLRGRARRAGISPGSRNAKSIPKTISVHRVDVLHGGFLPDTIKSVNLFIFI